MLSTVLLVLSLGLALAQSKPSCRCCDQMPAATACLTEAQMRDHVEHIEMEPDRMGDNTNLTGIAVFKLTFGSDGQVVCAKAISGHPLAVTLLMAAIGKWQFIPYARNGTARPVCGRLRVRFSMVKNVGTVKVVK